MNNPTIFIVNASWWNHGDEAAIRAMIDELIRLYPLSGITIQYNMSPIQNSPYKDNDNVKIIEHYPRTRNLLECALIYVFGSRIAFSKKGKAFVSAIKNSDIVLHAPGGPLIGDIYNSEKLCLTKLLLVKHFKKPYVFYAPSMGPFKKKKTNFLRKYILNNAKCVVLRESISQDYVKALCPEIKSIVTLDSAFQSRINFMQNGDLLNADKKLNSFISGNKKIIGITITDLQWNSKYFGNTLVESRIMSSFKRFVDYLIDKGYGVLFIPQLFGPINDADFMKDFCVPNCMVIDENYDCYFQQYIISKMYAVVGMRYHSNIFSAKMGSPFISIAYEQKMQGFMKDEGLLDYCIDINDLSFEELSKRFEYMEEHYDEYKSILAGKCEELREKSYQTTNLVKNIILEIEYTIDHSK